MAARPPEARLKFLRQAAYQLAISAPAISASLSSTCTNFMIDAEDDLPRAKKEWDALRREVCGACGNIMLPGWSSSVAYQSCQVLAKKDRSKPPKAPKKHLVSTCLRCDRKSVWSLQSRPPKHVSSKSIRKKVEKFAHTNNPVDGGEGKVVKSANATSKQRKKSRKGGLQAMLERNKSQSSGNGGLGLDLMDFMQ